jgi:hypothetical protein
MAIITIVPGPAGFEIANGDQKIRIAVPADTKGPPSDGGKTSGADPTRGAKGDTKAGPIFYPPIFAPLFVAPKAGTLVNHIAHIESLDQLGDVINEFSRVRERLGGDSPHQLTVTLSQHSIDIGRLHTLASGLDDDAHLVVLLQHDG